MLALAMRQATRNKSLENARKIGIPEWNDAATRELAQDVKSPLFIASSFSTKLDDAAIETFHAAPADIARLGFAVASAIHPEAPEVPDLDEPTRKLAGRIAEALLEAENPLIVTGITGGTDDMLNALVNIVSALTNKGKKPGISITFPESNSVGLALMDGGPLEDALELAGNDSSNTLVILENDLYRRIPAEKIDAVLNGNRNVIVLDYLKNPTTAKAGVVLPVATYAESAGTMVNNEGRAQRFYPVMPLKGSLKESWQWIINAHEGFGKKFRSRLEEI